MNQSSNIKNERPHVIVFGNEKGGSGKSTSAMHVAIALLRLGYRVGTIDLDARQGTLSRYLQNREAYNETSGHIVPCPVHRAIFQSDQDSIEARQHEEETQVAAALSELAPLCDFIVIDTPGTDNYLSRIGHSHADTLITPLNDSLIDLDLLARIDPKTHEIIEPSVYTQMVEEQNVAKVINGNAPMHWIVMRNRLSSFDTGNKKDIAELLEKMAHDFGFQLVPGFGERVIFREMFLKGLTLLDLKQETALTLSHIAARQEVRQLIHAIAPERRKGYVKPPKQDI